MVKNSSTNDLNLSKNDAYSFRENLNPFFKSKGPISISLICKVCNFASNTKDNNFTISDIKSLVDSTIKDINIRLSDGIYNGIYHENIPIEKISERKYFIKYPEFKFDVISYQPIYKTGDRGPTQFYGVNNNDIKLDGEINFINKERGVLFEFIEKEFSNKNPLLGLLLNDVLYKYPLHRIEKNKFVSNLFYPLELRGLTKASIFYIDSTVHQLSSNINSNL